jgi:hypothetical protein
MQELKRHFPVATDEVKQMVLSIFADTKKHFTDKLDSSKIKLMDKYFSKYCLLINQVDLVSVEVNFAENACKWVINEVIPAFVALAKESTEIKTNEIRSFLQIGFSHLDHLITKLIKGPQDAAESILVDSVCEKFILSLMELYPLLANNEEKQLCCFAFFCETLNLTSYRLNQDTNLKVSDFMSQQIKKCSKPALYSEEVQAAYFELLFSLMDKSLQVLASNAGLDFLIAVSTVPTLSRFDKNLRQLILSHKKKDFVFTANNKSAFYTLVLNTVKRAAKLDQFQSLELLSTTAAELH